MTFKELLALVCSKDSPQVRTDSRLVTDGDIFVAVKGTVCDGHSFINDAIANGTKYVICQKYRKRKTENGRQKKCKIILVEDSTEAAAILAQAGRGILQPDGYTGREFGWACRPAPGTAREGGS